MSVQINFDSSQVTPSTGTADAIPAGWYNVAMDESEMKPTKNSTPENPQAFLQCRFNIIDGQFAGRKLFARLNLRNANAQAVEIAYKDLAAICHAVGAIGMVQDTGMLHGRPLKVKVKLRPATAEYEAQNEISAYRNINDQTAVNAAPAANAGMPTFPAATAAPTWAAGPAQGQGAPYGAPQGAPQGQPTYAAPQGQQPPAQGGWQQPQGQQPWQQPQQQQPQGQPMQQPQGQQFQQPQQQPQQFQQPMQGQPQQQPMQQPQQQQFQQPAQTGNPAANQPPPWAQ